MTGKTNSADTPSDPMEAELDGQENSIEEKEGASRPGLKNRLRDIPPQVQKVYIEIDGKYYFAGRPDSLAFEDRGRSLKTRQDNPRVAASMVDIAEAKGWARLRVRGKEDFRREVWVQAAARGIEVKGYTAREEDLARLKKLVLGRTEKDAEERSVPEPSKDRTDDNRPAPVSLSDPLEKREKQAGINARALLNEKEDLAELARENPDLVNDIAAIKMGGKFSRHFSSDADRKWFMKLVRERVACNYLKGQGMPPIKIREERTMERPERAKEMEHER